jgi:hypothetical protein
MDGMEEVGRRIGVDVEFHRAEKAKILLRSIWRRSALAIGPRLDDEDCLVRSEGLTAAEMSRMRGTPVAQTTLIVG